MFKINLNFWMQCNCSTLFCLDNKNNLFLNASFASAAVFLAASLKFDAAFSATSFVFPATSFAFSATSFAFSVASFVSSTTFL